MGKGVEKEETKQTVRSCSCRALNAKLKEMNFLWRERKSHFLPAGAYMVGSGFGGRHK